VLTQRANRKSPAEPDSTGASSMLGIPSFLNSGMLDNVRKALEKISPGDMKKLEAAVGLGES
jgi:hypothetical protein